MVLQPQTDVFRYFSIPNEEFAYDLQWAGNSSIVGVALVNTGWRLGLIYCTNREARIFQCDENGFRKWGIRTFTSTFVALWLICFINSGYLSDLRRAAMSPRVFPSGDYVVWQDREVLGPHNGSRRILGRKLFEYSHDPKYVRFLAIASE